MNQTHNRRTSTDTVSTLDQNGQSGAVFIRADIVPVAARRGIVGEGSTERSVVNSRVVWHVKPGLDHEDGVALATELNRDRRDQNQTVRK